MDENTTQETVAVESVVDSVRVEKRLLACTDRDEYSRYALSCLYVSPSVDGGVWCFGCDGRCLSATRIEGTIGESQLIPRGVVPTTKKPAHVERTGDRWDDRLNRRYATIDPEARYPKVQDVFPDCADRVAVRIDATLLANIQTAISNSESQHVTLLVGKPNEAIGVLGADGIGVLMPVALEEWKTPALDYGNAVADIRSRLGE